jgi:hypothetical protein
VDVALEGAALALDPELLAAMDPDGTLPPLIARVALDAAATFDAPLSLRGKRARVETIFVRALSLDWGAVTLNATGDLRRNASGTFGGQIRLEVTGWPLILAALGRSGVIAPDMLGMAGQMAASMADPATGVLTLPLAVADSRVGLGPLVLGQLPRF